jgi:TctA family transporter
LRPGPLFGGISVTMTGDHSAGARAWLDSSATRTASDAALGGILLIAGALPIWDAGGLSFGEFLHFEAKLFPSAVGVAMLAVGVLLLARAALIRRPPSASWGVRNIVIVAAAVIALFIASWNGGMELMLLNFGPPEHAATLVLILVTLCALACRSHLQAAGLILLGLLFGAVGLDSITGQLRLTMGLEQLYSGFATPLVATGLLVVAEGLIGLMSPSLWVATYGWIRPAWRNVRVPLAAAIVLRIVAVLAVAAGCYFGFLYGGRAWDVGTVLALGTFGMACKLLGWNRLVLVMGCFYSATLEQTVRQTIFMTQGDLTLLWGKPIIASLSAASLILIALVLVLAARSSQKRRRANQAAI